MIDRVALIRACRGALYAHLGAGSETQGSGRDAVICLGLWLLDPALAIERLQRVLSRQDDDGLLPARPGRGRALPLHGSVIRVLFHAAELHKSDHVDHLGSLVPRIERFHRALEARDTAHLNPSRPEDERVVPVPPLRTDQHDVGRNAALIQSETDLADVAIHTGHEAQEIMVRRTRRAQALARRLWRHELDCFCARRSSGEWAELTAEGLLALYCGTAHADQARRIAERHLTTEGPFWGEHPLAQGAADELRLVSPMLNWMMITGLFRYGLDDLAARLHEETIKLVGQHGIWSHYQADTGGGQGQHQDPTTAAIVLHMLETPYDQQQLSLF